MNPGYVRLWRGQDTAELIKDNRAFALAAIIAMRARRTGGLNNGLEVGEAMLGDHREYGMTEGQYRAAKKRLEKYSVATFRTTNKGTIARLIFTGVFDPNLEHSNDQHNRLTTSSLQQANSDPHNRPTTSDTTTNKEKGKIENDNNQEDEEDTCLYLRHLERLKKEQSVENAVATLRAGHPAFKSVPDEMLTNTLYGQPDRQCWPEAIEGLVTAYAGAVVEYPARTLKNWLKGRSTQ